MVKWLCAMVILLGAGFAAAQPARVLSKRANASERNAEFQDALQKELAKYKHGDFLYRKSDIFERIIEARVEASLKTESQDPIDQVLPDQIESSFSLDISKTSANENETSIAISRANPNIIVAGANDDAMYNRSMPAYVTTNAGVSWKTYRLPTIDDNGFLASGDPMIISDENGTFYYAFLITNQTSGDVLSDILVASSTNATTWKLGNPVRGTTTANGFFEDKETIAVDVDPSSPHHGRLYIAWVHYDDNFGVSYQEVSYSDNKGLSWSEPVILSSQFGYFPLLRIGKNGVVFLSSSSGGDAPEGSHELFISHDGGATFDSSEIAEFIDYPVNNIGRSGLKGATGFRSFPYATYDVDLSTNKIYCCYGTYEDDSYAALYTTTSTDEGATWSTPIPVGDEQQSALDRFLPWVSVDQVERKAYLSYYSSEEDPDNVQSRFIRSPFDSTMAHISLGSNLFNPLNLGLSGESPFLGDYAGSDVNNGYFAAAWTENRPNRTDGEIFAYVSTPGTERVAQINTSPLSIGEAFPNPIRSAVAGTVSFALTTTEPCQLAIGIYDSRGVKVRETAQRISAATKTVIFDASNLPAGVYHFRFSDGEHAVDRAVSILR